MSFVAHLEQVRKRTLRAARAVPADRLEWKPAPGRFSAGDLLRHIAGAERFMWAENVCGRPSRYPGHGPELASGLEGVLDYMDRLHRDAVALFESLTASDLAAPCRTVGGVELPRERWLALMIEHEIHHRGQLYSLLGLMGVAAPPLYGLTEREVYERSTHD